uniref:Uncharacterized protein n=1 Tax=Rhipicephalus appendiculatus TaxID=34631 RepID=A0A131YU16_RHIAP
MITVKLFALHCMMLCTFAILTASIKLLKTRDLCPTPRKTSCPSRSKLNCLYTRGMLVGVLCARNGTPCEDIWKSVCLRPLTPSCQSHRRECVCSCVETNPVKQPSIRRHRG